MCCRRSLVLLAPVVSLALAACTQTPQAPQAQPADAAPAAAQAAAPAAAPAAPATPACPHEQFDTFLKHFGNEIALQEAATADPLRDSYVDAGAEPEPKTVEKQVPLAEVEWPVMPDPAGLSGRGREMTVTAQADGQMQVLMRTPDTSDQQVYTFARTPCWTLVSRADESI
ncbi:hypothetical protein C1922_19020 [Stenotrophomonas sp. ZAC14D2_NAIMI4_7]|uniref:hypothetical protein n=1 Tax=Stenotrophomonas sp. ZAC14D2_NAIMI4_7 TaxID=2072405 RepID=UPI000D53F8FA|nr:hypothetical protein [Stenotrophomonas sp. ZAC14D2_NAIMI4_7]AWH19256.1 hypothetical protein C1922_19020 [Stenotrophomonas sp. ZAC14D2_NAIMI4_7]